MALIQVSEGKAEELLGSVLLVPQVTPASRLQMCMGLRPIISDQWLHSLAFVVLTFPLKFLVSKEHRFFLISRHV